MVDIYLLTDAKLSRYEKVFELSDCEVENVPLQLEVLDNKNIKTQF